MSLRLCVKSAYLTKGLQEVGASHRYHDIYVVNDEQWLVLHLIREVSHVVR